MGSLTVTDTIHLYFIVKEIWNITQPADSAVNNNKKTNCLKGTLS